MEAKEEGLVPFGLLEVKVVEGFVDFRNVRYFSTNPDNELELKKWVTLGSDVGQVCHERPHGSTC